MRVSTGLLDLGGGLTSGFICVMGFINLFTLRLIVLVFY